MDNDVFQFSANSTDYSVRAVADAAQDTTPPVLAEDSFVLPEPVKTAPVDMNGFDLDQTPFQDPSWVAFKELVLADAVSGHADDHLIGAIGMSGDAHQIVHTDAGWILHIG